MWCAKFKCTLSPHACIRRQKIQLKGSKQKNFELSLNTCKECSHGKDVMENPNCFINRDCMNLAKKYMHTSINNSEVIIKNDRKK